MMSWMKEWNRDLFINPERGRHHKHQHQHVCFDSFFCYHSLAHALSCLEVPCPFKQGIVSTIQIKIVIFHWLYDYEIWWVEVWTPWDIRLDVGIFKAWSHLPYLIYRSCLHDYQNVTVLRAVFALKTTPRNWESEESVNFADQWEIDRLPQWSLQA